MNSDILVFDQKSNNHNLQDGDPEEDDADHNDWVEEVDGDKNEGDDELPEGENEPVTDEELRQLREDEAQRVMDETRNEQENANHRWNKQTIQSSRRRISVEIVECWRIVS